MLPASCSSLFRTGIVVGYEAQRLIVEMTAQESCEQCAQGRGCGLGLLARRGHQRIAVALPEPFQQGEQCGPQGYTLGDRVTISLPSTSVTLLAFFIYGLPLLLALLLSGVASLVSPLNWLAPVVFFIALVGGAVSVKYLLRGRGERFRPHLVS
jgi:sigma-E factor negative regulatory protein RseC